VRDRGRCVVEWGGGGGGGGLRLVTDGGDWSFSFGGGVMIAELQGSR
jgi:hypothetical protein